MLSSQSQKVKRLLIRLVKVNMGHQPRRVKKTLQVEAHQTRSSTILSSFRNTLRDLYSSTIVSLISEFGYY